MANGRSQKFILVVGGQETGKSTWCNQRMINYVKNTGKPGLNILPDDQEEIFENYGEVQIEKLNRLKKGSGIHNVFVNDPNDFSLIRWNKEDKTGFRDGMAFIDDPKSYLGSRDKEFRAFIGRRRQPNLDLMIALHALDEVPPSSSKYYTDLILFESNDDVSRWTIDNPKKFLPLVQHVNAISLKQKYYCEHYRMRNGSIFDPITGNKIA